MRMTELLRLVWLNINQNKFKSVMTSIGIVAGAATIVLVIAIGRGGQMDVAEQFAELNAGAIDVSYEYAGEEESSDGFSFGNAGRFFENMQGRFGRSGMAQNGNGMGRNSGADSGELPGGGGSGELPDGGFAPGTMDRSRNGENGNLESSEGDVRTNTKGPMNREADGNEDVNAGTGRDTAEGADKRDTAESIEANGGTETEESTGAKGSTESQDSTATSIVADRMNQEQIILTWEDVEDIERYVSGISGVTISYSIRGSVEGGSLTSEQTYTIAGVRENFASVSKLELAAGYFLSDTENDAKSRVCVLGATAAKELFGSAEEAQGQNIYIDDRTYTVSGVLKTSGSVTAGISPDTSIFVPYDAGIKYIAGENISPVITVIAEDVNVLDSVISGVGTVLEENYNNAEFTFEDSGSKMKAAESSNRILTMLLSAMAAIVFIVGGIGIMNVLFVSVKERTNEIGILKAIGTPKTTILVEFLIESAAISFIGGILGVAVSFAVIPLAEHYGVRTEISAAACMAALGFAVLTGTVFGLYPAWKASRLEPVDALNAE